MNRHLRSTIQHLEFSKKYFFRYRYQLLLISIITVALLAFVVWYVLQQKTIFFWDNSAYWMKTRGLAEWIAISPQSAIIGIVESVRRDEYNILFALPLTAATYLFGESRLVYILSIYILYFLPASLLMAAVCQRVIRGLYDTVWSEKWAYVFIWSVIALNPFIILPILGGYPDIVGLIPICISLLLYIRHRHDIKIKHLISIAALLLLATFLRRWYIFEAVGLIIAIGADQIILKQAWRINKHKIISLLRLTILPVTYISLFVFIAFDYARQLVTTDYTATYAAYKFHDSYVELGLYILNHYGIALSLIAVAGIIGLFLTKKNDRQLVAVLLMSQVFAFFAVGRVQTFDTHQYYLLTLGFLVGMCAFPYILTAKRSFVRPILIAAVMLVYTLSWWTMYGNFFTNNGLSDVEAAPQKRGDISTLKRLYVDVNDISASVPGSDTVYVLACSFTFNIDLFRNIPLSVGHKGIPIQSNKFTPSAIFDVAQGFDKSFFTSSIVIDSDPVGYITVHKEEQQIITILHNELQPGGRLRQYYEVLNTYSIDNGYTIFTYRRTGNIPQNIQNSIISEIRATHAESVPILD